MMFALREGQDGQTTLKLCLPGGTWLLDVTEKTKSVFPFNFFFLMSDLFFVLMYVHENSIYINIGDQSQESLLWLEMSNWTPHTQIAQSIKYKF